MKALDQGIPARAAGLAPDEIELVKVFNLLSMKPVIYAANVADGDLANGCDLSKQVFDFAAAEGNKAVLVSAQVESELALLDANDKQDFLGALGVTEESTGLRPLVRTAYESLGLQTFFTVGPIEARAWTIKKGSTAPQAAGVIHSDIEKGFIRAEIFSIDDIITYGNEKAIRDAGLYRSEGKEYVMREGDIALFRHN